MGQLQNVQRGILFTFFMYSLIIFVFFVIKMIKNRIDKDAGVDQQEGDKYIDNAEEKAKNNDDKSKSQEEDVSVTKDQMGTVVKKPKKKPSVSSGLSNQQATMNDLVIKVTKQQTNVDENESILVKLSLKLRHHVFYHLPFFFPVALNVVTGTSYSFIFVLFFFLQVVFGLFNDLKIHHRCTQNRIVRIIAQHFGYVLSFFAWVNLWGANTALMPFVIKKA